VVAGTSGQLPARCSVRGAERWCFAERGSSIAETAIVMSAVLMLMMVVVQCSLGYYGRMIVANAAQDGATRAVAQGASPDAGVSIARNVVSHAGGSLVNDVDVSATVSGDEMTVTVTGRVPSLVPFIASFVVTGRASAHRERFVSQGDSER
jgi:Flp pilus assembly protein TadG